MSTARVSTVGVQTIRTRRSVAAATTLVIGCGSAAADASAEALPSGRKGVLGVWVPQGTCSFRRVEFTADKMIVDTYGPERTGYPAEHTATTVRYTELEPGHMAIVPRGVGGAGTDWMVIDRDHITPGLATGCVYQRAKR